MNEPTNEPLSDLQKAIESVADKTLVIVQVEDMQQAEDRLIAELVSWGADLRRANMSGDNWKLDDVDQQIIQQVACQPDVRHQMVVPHADRLGVGSEHLLKLVEEPPSATTFWFLVTDETKLSVTIRSRANGHIRLGNWNDEELAELCADENGETDRDLVKLAKNGGAWAISLHKNDPEKLVTLKQLGSGWQEDVSELGSHVSRMLDQLCVGNAEVKKIQRRAFGRLFIQIARQNLKQLLRDNQISFEAFENQVKGLNDASQRLEAYAKVDWVLCGAVNTKRL